MKAWIENGRVRDVVNGDPAELFHPSIAANYNTAVPGGVQPGWELIDGVWQAPSVPEPDPADEPDPIPEPEPEYKALTFVEFVTLVRKAGQMTDEKAVEVLETSTDASIILLRKMLEMGGDAIHRDNVVVQDGLQTLVDKSFITGGGKDAILAAWPTL